MSEPQPPVATLEDLCRDLPLHQPPAELWARIARTTRPSPWRYAGASASALVLVVTATAVLAALLLPASSSVDRATPTLMEARVATTAVAEALVETDHALDELCRGVGVRACRRSALWSQRERLLEASARSATRESPIWL